jgi:glutamyl-tRNA synthetase
VIRVKAPDAGTLSFHDQVRGDVEIDAGALDDFVIRKADGFPTYHLAVVVDDTLMGVTHVIRGDEHLNNTFRHLVLQEALGVPRPVYAHLSVITNPDGSKMSKRDKDKALRAAVRQRGLESSEAVDAETWAWWLESKDHQLPIERAVALAREIGIELPAIEIDDFRRSGYLPEVMVNYLALLGWSPGGDVEKFDRDFLMERFDFDRVIRSPAKFDRDKLLAFNLDALQDLPEDAFVERLVAHARCFHPEYVETLGPARLELFARANRKRSKTLEDPFRDGGFFLTGDDALEFERSKGVRKALGGEPSGADLLAGVRAVLASLDPWTPEALERAVGVFAEERAGGKLGRIAQPLRVAVCGGTVSPPIFETLAILGRDSTVRRIDRCLDARAELCAT